MTDKTTLLWIKEHLEPCMPVHALYTKDWLAGITMRETGFLIMRYAPTMPPDQVFAKLRGDWGKRETDAQPKYHGFGCTQIDIDSYPSFITSGDWRDPVKCYLKTVDVLEEKRLYLEAVSKIRGDEMGKAVTAAYNSGQRRAQVDLADGHVDDTFTFHHDYVKTVWRYRALYRTL